MEICGHLLDRTVSKAARKNVEGARSVTFRTIRKVQMLRERERASGDCRYLNCITGCGNFHQRRSRYVGMLCRN
jgi:hypothetical protein